LSAFDGAAEDAEGAEDPEDPDAEGAEESEDTADVDALPDAVCAGTIDTPLTT